MVPLFFVFQITVLYWLNYCFSLNSVIKKFISKGTQSKSANKGANNESCSSDTE